MATSMLGTLRVPSSASALRVRSPGAAPLGAALPPGSSKVATLGAARRVVLQPRRSVALQALSSPEKPVVTDKVTDKATSPAAANVVPPLPTVEPKERKPLELGVELPTLSAAPRELPLDLLIVGCGPAGLGTANLASQRGLRVGLIDPYPLSRWPNNYGVWVDEFLELGFEDCFNKTWDKAAVVGLGADGTETMKLDRPYAQVNRDKLKLKLMHKCIAQGVTFLSEKVDYVDHGPTGAESSKVVTVDGRQLHARAVLDATGHARRLVEFEEEFTPGYQAAYGIMCEVESHPFPLNEMLFMDWRADHLTEESQAKNYALPTFLYAMPFDEHRIFLEETSLVARPAITFDELKDRMAQRLHSMGIVITSIEEDEYCLIPMGGVLPTFPQRTLGVGGTAGMVHPSTGFMVSKTLTSSGDLVEGIIANLEQGKKGEAFSDAVWNVVWPKSDLRLRTFMCFGMETLMGLDLLGTRRFFLTFFTLPKDIWSGFLSWNMTNARLARMAYLLFVTFPLEMRIQFFVTALPFMPSFILNFLSPDKNNFDSKPWGGLPELAKLNLSKKDDKDDHSGPGGRERGSMPPIPLPTKGYTRTEVEQAKSEMTALLGASLDEPRKPSALKDDRDWTRFQQQKVFTDQPPLKSVLAPLESGAELDVLVAGAGPAGLSLAAELAKQGLRVGVIAPDTSFTNNYGVWYDEFAELGLEGTLKNVYDDVLVWMDDRCPAGGSDLGRKYGQVDRRLLREELLRRCNEAGVRYHAALVKHVATEGGRGVSTVACSGDFTVTARLVTMATGHSRDSAVLYNQEQTPFGWQTAYGVEVRLPAHPFPVDRAVFMDFRQTDAEPVAGANLHRVPSFLYVLPSDRDTVFLEETCLASSVQVPFDELKRRLYRRMAYMGLSLEGATVLEEEASWIPLGGPTPIIPQPNVAFGAAAVMVHPASGYSIVNSLRRAAPVAAAIAKGLQDAGGEEASRLAWGVLWSGEQRRQMAFHQFGLELLTSLQIADLRAFFNTFYGLPQKLNQKFLSHDLSSSMLIYFAFVFFVNGNNKLRLLLTQHLAGEAGKRFLQVYYETLFKAAPTAAEMQQTVAGATERVSAERGRGEPALGVASQRTLDDRELVSGFQVKL